MNVEIWSDIVCPWCYIGKRRFESALEGFERRDAISVIWRSFLLDPGAPRTASGTTREMLARKYGVTLEEADAMQARVTRIAADEGLAYRLDRTLHESSFDAHRLVHFAAEKGLQDEMHERLFRAHFVEGEAISDPGTLARLAEEVGLGRLPAAQALEEGLFAAAVRDDVDRAARLGIRGVPFFVFDGKYGVSGAQTAETLRSVLEKAWSEQGA